VSTSRRLEGTTLTVDCGEGFIGKGAALVAFTLAVAVLMPPATSTLWWASPVALGVLAYFLPLLRRPYAFVFDARSGHITPRYCLTGRGDASRFSDWALVRTPLVRSEDPEVQLELCGADGKTLVLAKARPVIDGSQRSLSWACFGEPDEMLELRIRIAALTSLADGGYAGPNDAVR
jgi:hypothetical protein